MACARRRDAVDSAGVSDVPGLGAPRAERVARVHQKLPKIEFWPCRQHKLGFKSHNYYLRISSKPIHCAIGGETRTAKLALKESSPGGTSLYTDYSTRVDVRSVPVFALEEWLQGVEGNFDLLKMDCEGSEWEIVEKTDPRQFARFPVLLAEAHGDPVRNRPVAEFKRLVENLGYHTIRWDNKYHGLYIGVRK